MATPLNTTITIDGTRFNAAATHLGIHTAHEHTGLPIMGSIVSTISCVVDVHDEGNVPFTTLKNLWDLANGVTRDKIKDIKIDFWKDEAQQDVICSYTFKGWISSFNIDGGGGSNHMLSLQLQPALDQNNFVNITLGN